MAFTETAAQVLGSLGGRPLGAALARVGGVASFELTGEGGGEFLVDLERSVLAAPSAALQLIVRGQASDFMAAVEGRMSVSDGLTTGRLRVSGEAARVARFLEALEQHAAALRG